MSKPLKGYPFSDEPLSQLLDDITTHGEEDRSLMRDFAHEMARRLRALDAAVGKDPEAAYSGLYILAILNGEAQ